MSMLRLALEESSTGVAFREIEHTFYGRLTDFEQLKKAASFEHQEQWEVRLPKTDLNAGAGTIRIRKTVKTGEPEYVITTKTAAGNEGDKIEVAVPTTVDNFEQFKLLSEAGLIKDRFHFPVENSELVFEVDVFYRPGAAVGSGEYCDWVKIDLECKNRTDAIPPMPIELQDLITAPYGKRSEAEEARVSSLYKNEFISKNKHL